MKIQNRRLSTLCVTSAVATLTALSGSSALSAPLNLSPTPLFLSAGVAAESDHGDRRFGLHGLRSASAWQRRLGVVAHRERLRKLYGGDGQKLCRLHSQWLYGSARRWSAQLQQCEAIQRNNWRKYSYLFPNGDNGANDSYQRRLGDNTNDHFAIPPLPEYAWARAYEYNTAYFNPAKTYKPWFNDGGYTFSDSPPTAARFDPVFGPQPNAIDLTRDFAGTGSADLTHLPRHRLPGVAGNYYFRVQTGMVIPAGACIRPAADNWQVVGTAGCAVGVNNACLVTENGVPVTYTLAGKRGVAIRYFPATFYLSATTGLPTGFGYTAPPLTGSAPDGSPLLGLRDQTRELRDYRAVQRRDSELRELVHLLAQAPSGVARRLG